MKRVSSRVKFFNQDIFPPLFIGAICSAVFIVRGPARPSLAVVFSLVLVLYLLYLYQIRIFKVLDHVDDDGDALVCRKFGSEVRISFRDIREIRYAVIGSQELVTINLHAETQFGRVLYFWPLEKSLFDRQNEVIDELIDRIHKTNATDPPRDTETGPRQDLDLPEH